MNSLMGGASSGIMDATGADPLDGFGGGSAPGSMRPNSAAGPGSMGSMGPFGSPQPSISQSLLSDYNPMPSASARFYFFKCPLKSTNF